MAGRAQGAPWKQGVCAALGVRPGDLLAQAAQPRATYADLEPELVGAVERAIDFTAVVATD